MHAMRHLLALGLGLTVGGQLWAAGGVAQPEVCDRGCWGARPPSSTASQMTGLTRGVIHHTAFSGAYETSSLEESKANVRAVQNYHMDVNGWSDIGYHFLGDRLGNGFEGREGSLGSLPRGAHDGTNDKSMGFSMMGYFHEPYNQEPSVELRCAIYSLMAWKVPDPFDGFGGSAYGSQSSVGYLAGHRDVSSTACPGDLMYDVYIGDDFYAGEAREEVHNLITGAGGMCAGGPLCCPGAPVLDSVVGTAAGLELSWSDVGDVQGYRVYVSVDGGAAQAVDLPPGQTRWVDTSSTDGLLRTYEVTAVGTLTESAGSDVYAARHGGALVLVVDGNDRWLSQPENPGGNHSFAGDTGADLPELPFDTADNAAVVAGRVDLGSYEAVVWLLGEESTRDETFSQVEQAAVSAYLAQSGRLFVSGSEIGWDLVAQGTTADKDFYASALRASYVADDGGQYLAFAEPGGLFDGMGALDFSAGVMDVDYPDVIAPAAGAVADLYYTRTTDGGQVDHFAGVSYNGDAKIVYFGFPFEALQSSAQRAEVLARVLDFFGVSAGPPGGDGVHVAAVKLGLTGRGRTKAVAQVSVVDALGRPVEGVTVNGSFTQDINEQVSAQSGRTGTALLSSTPTRTAPVAVTFCVDSLSGAGVSWQSGADEADCVSLEAP